MERPSSFLPSSSPRLRTQTGRGPRTVRSLTLLYCLSKGSRRYGHLRQHYLGAVQVYWVTPQSQKLEASLRPHRCSLARRGYCFRGHRSTTPEHAATHYVVRVPRAWGRRLVFTRWSPEAGADARPGAGAGRRARALLFQCQCRRREQVRVSGLKELRQALCTSV